MTATKHTFIAAMGLLLLAACNSSGEKRKEEAKKKPRLVVAANQRITCDTLDANFYLPGMFAFSAADSHCVNRAKYFVYEFRHNTDTGLKMQITFINDPGKYDNTGELAKELDYLFTAYPDKKNNYGYIDTINKFPFIHVREKAGKRNWDADMVFSWVMSKYFSLKIIKTSSLNCDTACYQRMKDSVLASIVFQRTPIDTPVQSVADTPAAQSPEAAAAQQ